VAAVARLHVHGVGVDWAAFYTGTAARRVDLPTYPFQHTRFWPNDDTEPARTARPATSDDDEFWTAVEREDLGSLTASLDVDGDTLSAILPALSSWRRRRREESTVDGWRYRIGWKLLTSAPTRRDEGAWLAVVRSEPTASADAAVRMLGDRVVRIEMGADDTDRTALAARLAEHSGVTTVVSLLPDVVQTTVLIQALGDAGVGAALWCVTTGAVSTGSADVVVDPAQAAIWGLGRVAALEHPDRWGGLIDLPQLLDERAASRFVGVLGSLDDEDQVAIRDLGVFGRRLMPAQPHNNGAWQPRGTVLVTGGTGSLGGHVARWLAGNGAEHVVLASRRGPDAPGAAELTDELSALGVRVSVAACDMADHDAVSDLLSGLRSLTAVVHAAGVLDDGVIDSLTPKRFDAVFRSKVTSAMVLDELTDDLDAFVLFSSASGSVGNAGQANYAAANAVLDALAERRRGAGHAATSIAWGSWAGGGMADSAGAEVSARRTGVGAMAPDLALDALRRTVAGGEPTAVIAAIEPATFVRAFTDGRPSPLLREMPGYDELTSGSDVAASTTETLRNKLLGLSTMERTQLLLDLVRGQVAGILGLDPPEAIGAERAFRELGFDSLAAVELRNGLNAATGLRLSSSLVFDYPTPAALTDHLLDCLVPEPETDEEKLRAVLASVSVAQLREIGVLEPLLRLANAAAAYAGAGVADEPVDSIDEMDVDDLVQAALGGPA
jgi:acyl transferase domain-containing protein/acyl carrier protein